MKELSFIFSLILKKTFPKVNEWGRIFEVREGWKTHLLIRIKINNFPGPANAVYVNISRMHGKEHGGMLMLRVQLNSVLI